MSTATTTQLDQQTADGSIQLSNSAPSSPPPELEPPPPTERRRRHDKLTYLRLASSGLSFFVAGVNDGSLGALVPYVIRDYGINTAIVSSVYGANFFGWFAVALINTHLCQILDLGAMLLVGALLQVAAHALRAWKPPFPLLVVTFFLVSLGQAFQDTHANTFVASQRNAHRWLAFIHAMYSAGCLVGPFVATAVASAGQYSHWPLFYTFPLGLGILNTVLVYVSFSETVALKKQVSEEIRMGTLATEQPEAHAEASKNDNALRLIKETLSSRSVWLLSLFFFFFLGAALTAGGWVVEYLVMVRHGELSQMGYVPAGFNGGTLLGRLLLPEPTHRFGPRRVIFGCAILAIGLQLLFWLVPNIVAASIAISLLGFSMGPYFPVGIDLGSKLFSPRIRSTALSFIFVFAQLGGCVFPVVTGLIAAHAGVAVLQPILCGLLAATAISWLFVPRPKDTDNTSLHRE